MLRTRHPGPQFFTFTTAILAATSTLAITAVAQAKPAEPSAACSAYASIPLPPEAEKVPVPKTSPTCAAYRSYRGIGRPVNYSAARACAWQERLAQKADLPQSRPDGTAWVVGGSLILADIYFNGAGVKRNVPLAMRFACESEEGMGETAMPDIAKLNGSPSPGKPFEFCDYAATTFSETFCADYESEVTDDRRARYFNSLKPTMTPEQKAAFEKLLAAEHAYIQAHAGEVYQGGTIHGIRTVGSMDILQDIFRTEVVHFERKKWPALSATQITAADALLHREFAKQLQQLQTRPKQDTYGDVDVTAAQLSSVEKPWETYRDAWVAFARLRYPDAVAAIRAEITLDRYRLLKTIS